MYFHISSNVMAEEENRPRPLLLAAAVRAKERLPEVEKEVAAMAKEMAARAKEAAARAKEAAARAAGSGHKQAGNCGTLCCQRRRRRVIY